MVLSFQNYLNEVVKCMKKKIWVVVPFLYGTGGTETVLRNTQKAYDTCGKKDNYDLRLISFGGTKSNDWYDKWEKKVYFFPQYRFIQNFCYLLIVPFLLLKEIIIEKPDVIISTNPVLWTYCFIWRKITHQSYKVIAWYHYSIRQKPIRKMFLHNFDAILAISSGIKRQLLALNVPSSKIHVLFNPVDINSTISKVPVSQDKVEFLYIGRIDFNHQKNVVELFQALKKVQGNWRLRLFGTCNEMDQQRLIKMSKRYDFFDKITFEGYKEDVWQNISNASALIMTSKYEGFPMTLCEAISRGIFVVSSDCETGPEDIINDDNGVIYQLGDVSSLSEILNSILQGKIKIPMQQIITNTMKPFGLEKFIRNFEKYCDVEKISRRNVR